MPFNFLLFGSGCLFPFNYFCGWCRSINQLSHSHSHSRTEHRKQIVKQALHFRYFPSVNARHQMCTRGIRMCLCVFNTKKMYEIKFSQQHRYWHAIYMCFLVNSHMLHQFVGWFYQAHCRKYRIFEIKLENCLCQWRIWRFWSETNIPAFCWWHNHNM